MFLQFFAEENACHVSWINFYAMFIRSFWTILISSQFILEVMFKDLENFFLSLENLSLIFYFSIFTSLIWNFNNQWKYYKVIWNRSVDYSFLERFVKAAVRKNDVNRRCTWYGNSNRSINWRNGSFVRTLMKFWTFQVNKVKFVFHCSICLNFLQMILMAFPIITKWW